MSSEESLRKTESRISTIEGRIGWLKLSQEKTRDGIDKLIDKIQAVISKRADAATSVRKGLDIGDEYGPSNPNQSLEDAILARASNPQLSLNGSHREVED